MSNQLDWNRAIRHLDFLIAEYRALGLTGCFGLYFTLLPLRERIKSGERSQQLYDEIMECE